MSLVLVIEDEADVLLSIRLTLEIDRYQVQGTASAEEALTVLRRSTPDAILLDLRLPGMDGWTFLEALREQDRRPKIPVVIISAHADSQSEERALRAGCSGYLTKPFSPKVLLAALDAAISSAARPTGARAP